MTGTGRPSAFYACWYRLDGRDGYLLWYEGPETEAQDRVVVDENGRVPVFRALDELKAMAPRRGFDVIDEAPVQHDLDALGRWLTDPRVDNVEPDVLLAGWNIFGDIAISVGATFDPDPDTTIDLYQKLFWGNNLPAMTPPGERYVPTWTEVEIARMVDVLSEGLRLFREVLRDDTPLGET